jgi:hypothetical protein
MAEKDITSKELVVLVENFAAELQNHYDDGDVLDNWHCECVEKAANRMLDAMRKVTLAK